MPTKALAHEFDDQTLLRALTHRISGGLVSTINTISASVLRTDNPAVKLALAGVIELLEHHAEIHRELAMPDRHGLVDAAESIRKLAVGLSRSSLEPIGIRLVLSADKLPLETERCWRLALAVHELVTNAARHAHFEGRDGAIKIKLSVVGGVVSCIVADNGSRADRLRPAGGLQMVDGLASNLGGRVEYGFGSHFSSFLVVFPLSARERRANRVVASRRLRGMRKAMPRRSRPQPAQAPSVPAPDNLQIDPINTTEAALETT
ncbi:sensor histidine kinase [Bradyrhizobium sp. CER78]|uniref:sensor histidine kinase n=1 Tax=Bradyrhizobium sp. CER78 TaxID=3039162 RepID=UPI002446E980|nr:sensor histidine kinase [Bradyrhizobium sp. CER78]MDH2384970.1 sensor histidine kinase [Bradyrhizobium sp. CER78]